MHSKDDVRTGSTQQSGAAPEDSHVCGFTDPNSAGRYAGEDIDAVISRLETEVDKAEQEARAATAKLEQARIALNQAKALKDSVTQHCSQDCGKKQHPQCPSIEDCRVYKPVSIRSQTTRLRSTPFPNRHF